MNVNVVIYMIFFVVFVNFVYVCGVCIFKKLIFILFGVKILFIGCIGLYVYGVNEVLKSNFILFINYVCI